MGTIAQDMEPGDVTGPIRPLPPREPGGLPEPQPQRRWGALPLLVGVGVVTLTALALVLLAGSPLPSTDTSQPPALAESGAVPDFTTTTAGPALPPRLTDVVPGLDGPLQLLQGTGDRTSVAYWLPEARAPRVYETSVERGSAVGFSPVGFDSSGTYLAYLVASAPGSSDLHVGEAISQQPVQVGSPAVVAAIWHPADTGRLAWIVRDSSSDGESGTLFTGRAKPGGALEIEGSITGIPVGLSLAAWGDWGFALTGPGPIETDATSEWLDGTTRRSDLHIATILDPSGATIATAPGRVLGGNAVGDLIVFGSEVAYAMATGDGAADEDLGFAQPPVVLPEGINVTDHLLRIIATEPDIFPAGTAAPDAIEISPDGQRLAALLPTGGGTYRVHMITLERGAAQGRGGDLLVHFPQPVTLVGFLDGGRYVAVTHVEKPELVLIDWRSGAQYRVPLRNRTVLAAHL